MVTTSSTPPRTRNAELVRRIQRKAAGHEQEAELSALLAWVKLEGPSSRFAAELGLTGREFTALLERALELLKGDAEFATTFFRLNASFYTTRGYRPSADR